MFPGFRRWIPEYLAMKDTANAVIQLDPEFGKFMTVENTCFGYVSDSSGFYNAPSDEFPNGLVIGPTQAQSVC